MTIRPPAALCVLGLWLGLACTAPAHTAGLGSVRTYYGLCDASAAAILDADHFAVGDDEDNIIRVYHRRAGVLPVFSLDLSPFLEADSENPEADLEGAARLGDWIYWITSHGRNRKSEDSPGRQRFFAVAASVRDGLARLDPVGMPYKRLLDDLLADPRLERFDLAAAAKLAPKTRGALNIEGLTATPQGHLWIGFRSPVPQGQALLVPMLNPAEVIAGHRARLGDPILLPLDGRGIRSITPWRGGYLIVAGSTGDDAPSELYLWSGGADRPQRLAGAGFTGLNPEALADFAPPGEDDLLVMSDDGNLLVGKKPCKKLKKPSQKRFRAGVLSPVAASIGPDRPAIR